VRPGNVIAFGVAGYKAKESVVVVAETKSPADELELLRKRIHHVVLDAVGVPPRDVMLIRSGTMAKTSSGKLQRALCREQYLADELLLAD